MQCTYIVVNFPGSHAPVDQDLYQRLKWRYDSLRDGILENGFQYCGMFCAYWIAEDLVKNKEEHHLLDTGHSFVKLLVDRCFLKFMRGVFQL